MRKKSLFFAFPVFFLLKKIQLQFIVSPTVWTTPGNTAMKKHKRHSFTLIELLAVIGLLALLIGIFTPAFSRMMQGSQVDQTSSKFKTGMEVAQAKAVASRKYVAMIIPSVASEADPQFRPYCNGGYRLAYVKRDGNEYVFDSWVPGQQWSNMVDGAMLVRILRRKDWYNTAGDNDSGVKGLNTKPEDAATATVNLASESDDKLTGYDILTEVTVPSEGISDEDDIKLIGSENLRAIVFTPFGGCAGGDEPLLLFFTEALLNDGTYAYSNMDNFLVLKLNPITGKVVYLSMEDGDE